MSSDETPKIEPSLTSIEAAPSITPAAGEPAPEVKTEAPAPEIKPDAEKLPPAPSLAPEIKAEKPAEATIIRMPALRPEQKADAPAPDVIIKPRVARFALLAACVAIAASLGAIGGSLGVAKFGLIASAPPAAPAPKENVAEEVKALKDTVAQLRGTTKTLSDNLAALKTSVNASNTTQNTQIGKIAETLDRVEKTQAEQRKTAAAAVPETTGSIAQQKQQTPVPMVLGDPPTTLKPPIVQGWVLRRVYDGAALIEGRDGIIEVEPGSVAPGLGRIEAIKRQDGRWVVMTARGLIVQR